ncbi:F0F1 ATP synthase subunit A [Leucothrix mucor]|uniref:F0F1 ATP synthase subunit A n=1 Tax=Leucothrix mucor TaxID=45248 RepID=UPI0003B47CE6|nr:F0F1 ATP synthase subunit A [Leucothrix mucor]
MHLSSDESIYWQWGFFNLNLTIVTTWAVMLLMVGGAWLVTRKLNDGLEIPRWQNVLEVIVLGVKDQIEEVGLKQSRRYMPFVGTLFLFILVSNLLGVLPWYEPPTGSLSTTAALALCVFLAVPFFGIREQGIANYLKSYVKPTPVMLPFNIISELSRTLALAIRLFGNIMSGAMILAILLMVTPFIFPVLMNVLHLLTGVVQAYIFSILATVYIAAATSGKAA